MSGIEVTYRSRNYSKTAISPKPTPAWVTAHKAGNVKPTAQPAGSSAMESVLSRSGASVDWNLFRAAPLVSASLSFGLSLLFTLGGKGLGNPVSFRDFLKLF